MIKSQLLKEIIISNEEFILRHINKIVEREGIGIPETLRKTVVFYGVRRSGKTFILFDLFKKYQDNSVYMDFEDDRLSGFELKDFETLKDAALELKPHLAEKTLVLLLDEVQRIKGWERFCRRAVERENIKVKVLTPKGTPYEVIVTNKVISMKTLIIKSLLTSLYQREDLYPSLVKRG